MNETQQRIIDLVNSKSKQNQHNNYYNKNPNNA